MRTDGTRARASGATNRDRWRLRDTARNRRMAQYMSEVAIHSRDILARNIHNARATVHEMYSRVPGCDSTCSRRPCRSRASDSAPALPVRALRKRRVPVARDLMRIFPRLGKRFVFHVCQVADRSGLKLWPCAVPLLSHLQTVVIPTYPRRPRPPKTYRRER